MKIQFPESWGMCPICKNHAEHRASGGHTLSEYVAVIPISVEDAKFTGFYDWYLQTDCAKNWDDFRDDLIAELTA